MSHEIEYIQKDNCSDGKQKYFGIGKKRQRCVGEKER